MSKSEPLDKKAKRSRRRKRFWLGFLTLMIITSAVLVGMYVPFGKYDLLPGEENTTDHITFDYGVPLDHTSPWPKFRANELSNGRSSLIPIVNSSFEPWVFQTGKGIFSSPVVDHEGTVYVGSADHYFYAINRNGTLKWAIETGEIIDSAALLDDEGHVIFGSGDAQVYCADRETGTIVWTFKAHTVEEAEAEFGLETHNVNWFEGNIGMLADGSILAPNDNQILYALDPETGEKSDVFLGNEMLWSLPAVNPETEKLFFGTTNFALTTVYSYHTDTGKKSWTTGGLGSVAASPLLTSTKQNGAVIVGAFDGIVRAYTQKNGKQLWKVGLNDHIYASPAQLSDGTIIQPGADGTVYAIDPANGDILWKFDTLEAIRSSPAVDGNDVIYVGSGEGKLFAINPDGTLRWAYQLINSERNDLNSSPALGFEGIYIAGESGEIFFMPYDYPLSSTGLSDPNSVIGPDEALPENGVFLIYTTAFGGLLLTPPDQIAANQPLTFSLFIREQGDTLLSAINRDSISVSVTGNPNIFVSVAANQRFLSIVPQEKWIDLEGGSITVQIAGTYKTNMRRIGLKFFGGRTAGNLDKSFTFNILPRSSQASPFQAPNLHGGNTTVIEFSRLSAPNPTMLPSYNQIGFDSLHYLGSTIKMSDNTSILWVIGGKLDGNQTVVDPDLKARYPLKMAYEDGLVTFYNYDGFKINFIGSWDMPFSFYRISSTLDPNSGNFDDFGTLSAIANCDEIKFYGTGLKLMGMSEFDTGKMTVFGGMNLDVWYNGTNNLTQSIGTPTFSHSDDGLSVELANSEYMGEEHVFSLLLMDANNNPLPLYYTQNTHISVDALGNLTGVSLDFEKDEKVSGEITIYLMVDTFIALETTINFDE